MPPYPQAITILQNAATLLTSINSVTHPATKGIPLAIRALSRVLTACIRYWTTNPAMYDLLRAEQAKTATQAAPRRASARTAGAAG